MRLGTYKGIHMTRPNTEVTKHEVLNVLKKKQKEYAVATNIDDRSAQEGDQVILDFQGMYHGQDIPHGNGSDFALTIGAKAFLPEFDDALIGKNIGDTFDINVTFPTDYRISTMQNRSVVFHTTLKKIRLMDYQPIDDEFAKDVSEFDTLAALRKDIKAKKLKTLQENADRAFENAAVELAGKNMTCDIPACMIDEQLDKHLEQFGYQLQAQGMKLEDYAKMMGGDLNGMRAAMRPMAEQTVRSNILLSEIVHQENIEVSEEEVEEELKKLAEQYGMELEKVKEAVDMEALKADLAGKKAVKLIVDSAVPVEEKKTAKKTAKKASKKEDAEEAEEAPAAAEEEGKE